MQDALIEFEAHHVPRDRYLLEYAGCYQDGAPALVLLDPRTREQWCKLTVFIEGVTPQPGAIIVKDWSENSGVIDGLLIHDHIHPMCDAIPLQDGRVTAYLVWLKPHLVDLDPRTRKEPMAAE